MNKAAFFLLFFMLFLPVQASLLVGIQPKTLNNNILYPSQTAEFVVSVLNEGDVSVQDVSLKITALQEITILKNEAELKQTTETIQEIRPSERKRVFFTVKAGEKLSQDSGILVEYGLNNSFSQSVRTNIQVVNSPLQLEARALGTPIKVGDKSSIAVSAKNLGPQKIENLLIELALPLGITPLSPPLLIPVLNPGEGFADKGFGFELDPALSGKRTIIVRASFFENGIQKFVEKNIDIQIENKDLVVGGMLLAIILLAAIALFMKKGKKQQTKQEKKEEPH